MRGGYDAANLLVPISSDFYYESRPTIAVPRPGADNLSAISLDRDWGLHPALRESIYPLFQKRQAAFVAFAGCDDLSRSHFETQDTIELGQSLGSARNYQSGFLNRLATVLRGRDAMAFTDQLPLIFRGSAQVPNVGLKQVGQSGLDDHQSSIINAMYRNTAMAGTVQEGFGVRDQVRQEASAEMQASGRQAVSSKGFELEARRIAHLMKERYSIGFVDVGGWDTHVGQGAGSGYLAGRFEELGRGLAAYADEMGTRWKDTVVVVVSEFGRTFHENGNRGTDHGHGSVYWVLGGSLAGGRVAGEQVAVKAENLLQKRDLPVLTDYRALLAGLFQRMYGLSGAQLETVFPGYGGLKDLGLV